MNFKSYFRKFLVKPRLMNISTLMQGQLHIQECREKSIAVILQSEDTTLINYWDDEIADDDKEDVRKVTASEALDSVVTVNCFAEIHGDKQMNVMLNKLIEPVKLQNARQKYYPYVF